MRLSLVYALFPAVLAVVLVSSALPEDQSPWDDFDLATSEAGGFTVHHEKSLEPEMDAVRTVIGEFSARLAENRNAIEKLGGADGVLVEIDAITGLKPDEKFAAFRRKMFDWLSRTSVFTSLRDIYVLQGSTIKEHLRVGGTVPGFTYDKAADKANYRFIASPDEGACANPLFLVIPVLQPGRAAETIGGLLKFPALGTAIHEVAEGAILQRLHSPDFHIRWFSDGYADAIAAKLLEEHLGRDAADSFVAASHIAEHKDLEKKLNLAFWLSAGLAVETGIESERCLELARYAYAGYEAMRVLDTHGLDSLRKVFETFPSTDVTSSQIAQAIRAVTGEDVAARLALYQEFPTVDEGRQLYLKSAPMPWPKEITPLS